MKLTFEQKMKLIDERIITARVFNLQEFKGWWHDWVSYYDWDLDSKLNSYNKLSLFLLDKHSGQKRYEILVSPKAWKIIK